MRLPQHLRRRNRDAESAPETLSRDERLVFQHGKAVPRAEPLVRGDER
jgi:hypothetical protein